MSATNWAICPRCKARDRAEREGLDAERARSLIEAYGNVPPDEYLALVNAPIDYPLAVGQSFREDYGIYGAELGVVVVVYSGDCDICHLSLSFRNEIPIPDVDK